MSPITRGAKASLAAFLILLTIATRAPLLERPQAIDDEVVYATVAHEMLAGGTLYVDVVDRKPPLLFWVYAAIFAVFGAYDWSALHAVAVGWVLLTMAGLFIAGRRLFDWETGFVAAALYSVFQPWAYWNNLAFNGEVLMNLPVVWALVLVVGGRERARGWSSLIGAGVLISAAFLLKQPAAITILPLFVYLLHPEHRTRCSTGRSVARAAAVASGAGLGLAGVAWWFVREGTLAEAVYWTVGDHDVPHVFLATALERTALFAAACLPMVVGGVAALVRRDLWRGRRAARDMFAALTVVSAVGVSASGRFFPHYYIALVPPLALLAAPVLADLWRRRPQPGRQRVLAAAAALSMVTAPIAFFFVHTHQFRRLAPDTEEGRYLRQYSTPDDRLFVWGRAPRLYLDARRRPASRYVHTFALTGHIFGPRLNGVDTRDRILPGAWDNLRADFARHPPAFVVDLEVAPGSLYPASMFPELAGLLREHYEPVIRLAGSTIYRRIAPRTAATDR